MIFRRKKSDGFDWHTYVRTTIQLRRDQRRARLDQIGRVAADHAKQAGNLALGGVAVVAQSGGKATAFAWRKTIAQPAVAFPLMLVGGMALLSGTYRWFAVAQDANAVLPLTLGFVVTVLVAPLAFVHIWQARAEARQETPDGAANGSNGSSALATAIRSAYLQKAASAAAIALAALALGWFAWGRVGSGQGPGSAASGFGSTPGAAAAMIEGRATVLSGEMIRLQGQLLHLSGIEAPDRQQTCTRANQQAWRCGAAATAALERLARAQPFRCAIEAPAGATGRSEASCSVDGRDVAGELVKDGYVFSTATYFGGYAALESEARRSGNNLWSGEAERPSAYHAKVWAAAKARAPNGCPIKGQVGGSNRRTYLMPWAQRYASATVRPSHGERWFCTEADARAAGFTAHDTLAAKKTGKIANR